MRAKESVRKSKPQKPKEKTSIDLYDKYWQRGNFMAVKSQQEQVCRPPATREPKDENRPVCANPVQRFSLTKSFGAIDFDRLVVRQSLKRALAAGLSAAESQEFESQVDRREKVFKKYLLRFLLVSRRQSWQRKYRPISTDQLFSAENAEKVRQWVLTFFERKEEAAEKSLFAETDSDLQFRSSDKKFRIQDHRGHSYRCLVLVGKAGVGKTTAIEAVCQENGYHLECIDCTWFNSFADLKKKYAEAVKSQAVGPSTRKQNEQPTLSPFCQFFKASQPGPDKPDWDQESPKPQKKIFLLNNFDSFFDREQETDQSVADRLGKQMVEFSDFSSFPFIIEATEKSKVGQYLDGARFFDHIRYADPDLPFCSWVLHVVARLETVSRGAEAAEARRYSENELVDRSSDWQAIAQQAIDQLDARVAAADPGTACWTLQQLSDFVCSYNFDLHRVMANLSYQVHYSPRAALTPRQSAPGPAEAPEPEDSTGTAVRRYLTGVINPGLASSQPTEADEQDRQFVCELRRRHVRCIDPDLLTCLQLLAAEPPADSPLRATPARGFSPAETPPPAQ